MSNYFYQIGKLWPSFNTLAEARKHMRDVIKSDKNISALNRDNQGKYYILRTHIYTMKTVRLYL